MLQRNMSIVIVLLTFSHSFSDWKTEGSKDERKLFVAIISQAVLFI